MWAGLMAACYTENTSCYLSGSAPRRQALQQTLMSVVSEKGMLTGALLLSPHLCTCLCVFDCVANTFLRFCVSVRSVDEIERPLAQALEGWVLQQAVTGLMLEGQLEQAEVLCTQVGYWGLTHTVCTPLTLSPKH